MTQILYNQVFDEYTNKIMWLCNKQGFSQQKRFVISKDITERMFIDLLRVHEQVKSLNNLPNALDFGIELSKRP